MSDNISKYRELCKKKKLPLFFQDRWLDAVNPDSWDCSIDDRSDGIYGVFPYVKISKYGFNAVISPTLTHRSGFLFFYPENQKFPKRYKFEKKCSETLLEGIGRFDHFDVGFHYDYDNWLPLMWQGFSQTTRYSHFIYDTSNLENVLSDADNRFIRLKNKHFKNYTCEETFDASLIYSFEHENFNEQKLKLPYDKKIIENIINLGKTDGVVKCLVAKDQNSKVCATLVFVVDKSVYLLVGSKSKDNTDNAATYFLFWKAVEFANKMGLPLDFGGSVVSRFELRNRSFGAQLRPYYHISKTNSKLLKLYFGIKDILR